MNRILILAAAGLFLAGCNKENGSEPKVDGSVSIDLGKEKEKLGNALDKTGAEIKKGAHEAKEKLEEAGTAIKKEAEAAKDKLTDDKKKGVTVEVNTK